MRAAASQLGLITAADALKFLSRQAIRRRLSAGLWRKVLPDIYTLSPSNLTIDQRVMAASLWVRSAQAARDRSCVSHTTAGWLLGLGTHPEPVHVMSPRSLTSPAKWLVHHRVCLEPKEVTSVNRIATTIPARTLLDLGAVCSSDEVESALETALRKGTVSLHRLERFVAERARKGSRGASTLRKLLRDRQNDYIPSESELELRLFRILRKARLPLPVKQQVVIDQGRFIARVDFAYPDRGLVIEVHGWKYHGQRDRWNQDLRRGNRLTLAGARTLEFTWRDVTHNPNEVAGSIREALVRFPGAQQRLGV